MIHREIIEFEYLKSASWWTCNELGIASQSQRLSYNTAPAAATTV